MIVKVGRREVGFGVGRVVGVGVTKTTEEDRPIAMEYADRRFCSEDTAVLDCNGDTRFVFYASTN